VERDDEVWEPNGERCGATRNSTHKQDVKVVKGLAVDSETGTVNAVLRSSNRGSSFTQMR